MKTAPPPEAFAFLARQKGDWMKPADVARALDKGIGFVYGLIEEGSLEMIAPPNRAKKRYSVTTRSVLRVIAGMADFDPCQFEAWADKFIDALSPMQLDRLSGRLATRPK